MTLILSLAALLLGPLIYSAGKRYAPFRRLLDLSILVAIAIIVLLHVIPDAWAVAGTWVLLVVAVGLLFPAALETLFRHAHESAHRVIVVLAAIGLLLHAAVDGLALSPQSGAAIGWGIVLHRIPIGMAIWWTVRPALGRTAAIAAFALIAVATVGGYLVGDRLLAVAESLPLMLLQAFVAGSLVHVAVFGVMHRD